MHSGRRGGSQIALEDSGIIYCSAFDVIVTWRKLDGKC